MARKRKQRTSKRVEALTHEDASRKNIPTAEYQTALAKDDRSPVQVAYERSNRDLDPQLVWRGKDVRDWADLVVPAPPLFIQEKVHPKALIDDLLCNNAETRAQDAPQVDLFADFNGLPDDNARTEFYQHDASWANRMILGDSLQVMTSLAAREGLGRGVQCIYIDPPYGITFNSNFQWSTTSRDVKDGKAEHITREPEQVKAYRDTWRHGIHSYLTYLRDRLTVARDLLTESGSVFVQIGDENVHRVRAVMDELFGDTNFVSTIRFRKKTMPLGAKYIEEMYDFILWYAKDAGRVKYRQLMERKDYSGDFHWNNYEDATLARHRVTKRELEGGFVLSPQAKRYRLVSLWPASFNATAVFPVRFRGADWMPPTGQCWPTSPENMRRLIWANQIEVEGRNLRKVVYEEGAEWAKVTSTWSDTVGARSKSYVIETSPEVVKRCILMTTDPGDLVLDPTCGSGTTAYVAEQWGRRWITIDTSRVALALARARVMGARYPYYLLSDSPEGRQKEAELSRKAPTESPTQGAIRQGFVYERVPHITLKSIANNAEIDVIYENYQAALEPLRQTLNKTLKRKWEEWEIPRNAEARWPEDARELHAHWWEQRIKRQNEIDASIAAKADYEYLYDRPFEDKQRVRVAGPFTVESLSPHRMLDAQAQPANEDGVTEARAVYQVSGREQRDFAAIILDNLHTAGVQQAHKEDRIAFTALTPWPGESVCAEGRYAEGDEDSGSERRAGIFVGPEFGTVSRPDLVDAAREAAEAGFDVLIACAFNYDAGASEFTKLGALSVLKARMNADLHMAEDLKNTGKGNLFVVFGEPDIDVKKANGQLRVTVRGVDVYHPASGDIRSDNADGIACWFVDTDYNGESFFVRHAYFLGAKTSDPYKSLKTTLKAEIDADAWNTLYSATSRPFEKPKSGRIAVKVINHLGDEVMKVVKV